MPGVWDSNPKQCSLKRAEISNMHHYTLAARFLRHLLTWSALRDDIRAVILVGSYARGAARPDSDVDIRLLVVEPRTYTDDHSWVAVFGTVNDVAVRTYDRVTCIQVSFSSAPVIEFGITDAEWTSEPDDGGARSAREGMLVLLDRDGPSTLLSKQFEQLGDRLNPTRAALARVSPDFERRTV